MGLSTFCRDLLDQRFELVGRATGYARDVSLARKAPGDRTTGRITGTDDEDCFLVSHL
jgi:hypothetical protein